jgi:hypothetical protein
MASPDLITKGGWRKHNLVTAAPGLCRGPVSFQNRRTGATEGMPWLPARRPCVLLLWPQAGVAGERAAAAESDKKPQS